MARSRSSIFSSESLLRDLAIAALALLAVEWQLHLSLVPLEARNAALGAPLPASDARENYRALGLREPAAFLAAARDQLAPPVIVFVGDSQGMVVKDTTGFPYPRRVARVLAGRPGGGSVLSLQLGGATTVEQGALLLGLLRDGLVPGVVFWGHTVFSLRKNEIRAELVPLYGSLPAAETGSPAVILIGGPTRPAGEAPPLPQRVLQAATQRLDQWCSASAMVRFSRRELSEKADLLWRTPLGGLVPPRLRPGTGVQRDPSASVLEGNARFAGQVTAVLRARGVRVIHFLAPVNRATEPRPFSARSEAVAYPALERAVRARGGEYVSWLDLLPPSCFGRFVDGSADALHIRPAGHTALVRRILALLDEAPRRAAGAAPAR